MPGSVDIKCAKCGKHLGKILEGSILRKGMVHLCEQCETQRKALEMRFSGGKSSSPFEGLFDGLFK